MDQRNKVKIKNSLFVKIYVYFAIMLTVMAILVGLIFIQLYETVSTEKYITETIEQAKSIANRLSISIFNNQTDNYLEYLAIIQEYDKNVPDIWTISNPNAANPMNKEKYEAIDISDVTLPEDCMGVIEAAFSNRVDYETGYYEVFGGLSVITGAPVRVNGEVVGIVLLVSQVKDQEKLIESSVNLILLSVGVSLFISFVIAIVFAKGLSTPISKMRITAMELSRGRFQSKTGIHRKDEIGDLARTIDILAVELQENEEERLNREQVRIDFFANVSHELRTPITVIRAYAETLIDGVITEEEKIQQYYTRILGECKGMERLVGDLLLLSKMQNPDFIVEKEPVNVLQVFDDLIRSVHAISSEKHIEIEIEKELSVYMMMGDYDRLRQMFLIILDNAIKFSEVHSVVHIKIEKKDKLIITIKDHGVGISEEELLSVFDKFYKSKLKQNAEGSGLGLAIAKQIAHKHDGTINVNSQLGVGTTFVFSFQCLEDYVGQLDV